MSKIFESGYERPKPKIVYTPGPDWTFNWYGYKYDIVRGTASKWRWEDRDQVVDFASDPDEDGFRRSFKTLYHWVYKSREAAMKGLIAYLRRERESMQEQIRDLDEIIGDIDVELKEMAYEAKHGRKTDLAT